MIYLKFQKKSFIKLIDRLNVSSNEHDIKKDYLNLKSQNDGQGKVLDELFIEKGK